jgi:hypothetical protein
MKYIYYHIIKYKKLDEFGIRRFNNFVRGGGYRFEKLKSFRNNFYMFNSMEQERTCYKWRSFDWHNQQKGHIGFYNDPYLKELSTKYKDIKCALPYKDPKAEKEDWSYSKYFLSEEKIDIINWSSWYDDTYLEKKRLFLYEQELKKRLYNTQVLYNYYLAWNILADKIRETSRKVPLSKQSLLYKIQLNKDKRYIRVENQKFKKIFQDNMQAKKLIFKEFVDIEDDSQEELELTLADNDDEGDQTPDMDNIDPDEVIIKKRNSSDALLRSFIDWDLLQTGFIDTRAKSRAIHGQTGFLGYNCSHITDDDIIISPRVVVNKDNIVLQQVKQWPRSKLKSKKKENYFQFLEIRDQLFRYYYLEDGTSLKYEVLNFEKEEFEDDDWIWRHARLSDWYFDGLMKEVYHRFWMDDIAVCDPDFLSSKFFKKDFTIIFGIYIAFTIFLLMIALGSFILKDWLSGPTIDSGLSLSHTAHQLDKKYNIFKPSSVNGLKAYKWFLIDYPVHLNITSDKGIQSCTLTLHPETYKVSLNKYKLNLHTYFKQDVLFLGEGWKHTQKIVGFDKTSAFRNTGTYFKTPFIFSGQRRYRWDGYVSRRRLLQVPEIFCLQNDRRGSFLNLKGLNSTWIRHYEEDVPEGQIRSIEHKYHIDLLGKLFRFVMWYTPGTVSDTIGNMTVIRHRLTLIEQWDSLTNFEGYYMLAHPYTYKRYNLSSLHPLSFAYHKKHGDWFKHLTAPTRNFRKDFIYRVPINQEMSIEALYTPKLKFVNKWLIRRRYFENLRKLDYMYYKYSPTQQTRFLSKAYNHVKPLLKQGYDIPNTGLHNRPFKIPKILDIHFSDDIRIGNYYQVWKAKFLNKYQWIYSVQEGTIIRTSDWEKYIEIKPFFDYMVNYDLTKLNLAYTNLPYYAMPINEDKAYLLEQYSRPKTRKKIKKATFKLLNLIKSCDKLYPDYNVSEKFEKMSILDYMSNGIMYRVIKNNPEPFPVTNKVINDFISGGTGLIDDAELSESLYGYDFDATFPPTIAPTEFSANRVADVFLAYQRDYFILRARLLIDQNKSKVCMRKILQLYQNDYYNLI